MTVGALLFHRLPFAANVVAARRAVPRLAPLPRAVAAFGAGRA